MKSKILTVEDSFEVRVALEMALTQEGYLVRACADGQSGRQEFSSFEPDLVLLDIRMPGISGIELCRWIRGVSHVPIIIFSAVEDRAEKIEAFEAGADDYVVKGTGIDELLMRVAVNLRWKREAKPQDPDEESDSAEAERMWERLMEGADGTPGGEAGKRPWTPARHKAKARPRYPRVNVPRYEGAKGSAVLVADPNPADRGKLAHTLEHMGHPVIETESGVQTLRTIARYLPWLVLTEIVMPDIDAINMLKLIYEHPRTRHIAIVVVTGKGSPEARSVAHQYGALDYIVKPWADEEVALRIQWAKQSLERKKSLYEDAA